MARILTPDQWSDIRWPNFTYEEMLCQETEKSGMDEDFMDLVQRLRNRFGRLVLNSAFRDKEHSAERDKPTGPGTHYLGVAIDPKVETGDERYRLVRIALKLGFEGIGIAKTFVHLDKPIPGTFHAHRPNIWTYS